MSRHFESTIAIKRIPLFFFVLLLRSRDYQQKGFSLFSFFFLYFLSPTHLFQRLHVSTFNGVPSEAQKKKTGREKKKELESSVNVKNRFRSQRISQNPLSIPPKAPTRQQNCIFKLKAQWHSVGGIACSFSYTFVQQKKNTRGSSENK